MTAGKAAYHVFSVSSSHDFEHIFPFFFIAKLIFFWPVRALHIAIVLKNPSIWPFVDMLLNCGSLQNKILLQPKTLQTLKHHNLINYDLIDIFTSINDIIAEKYEILPKDSLQPKWNCMPILETLKPDCNVIRVENRAMRETIIIYICDVIVQYLIEHPLSLAHP